MRKKSETCKDPPTAVLPHVIEKEVMATTTLRSRRPTRSSRHPERQPRPVPAGASRQTSRLAQRGWREGHGNGLPESARGETFPPIPSGKKPPLPEKRGQSITRSRKTFSRIDPETGRFEMNFRTIRGIGTSKWGLRRPARPAGSSSANLSEPSENTPLSAYEASRSDDHRLSLGNRPLRGGCRRHRRRSGGIPRGREPRQSPVAAPSR